MPLITSPPSRAELVTLATEMVDSARQMTRAPFMKPHGIIMAGRDDENNAMSVRGRHIFSASITAHESRAEQGDKSTLQEMIFASAIVWGYSKDNSELLKMWQRKNIDTFIGFPNKSITECTKAVLEQFEKDIEEANSEGLLHATVESSLDDDVKHNGPLMIQWLTGCYMGQYFRDIAALEEVPTDERN